MNFNSVCGADHPLTPDGFSEVRIDIVANSGAFGHIRVYPDEISSMFTVKVSEAKPDGVALRNLDFLDKLEVVWISLRVIRRGQDATCWLLFFRRCRTLKYD